MATIEIHLEGLPETQRLLARYQGQQLQNRMRRVVRAGIKPFQGGLKAEAASHHGGPENVPLSFQKVPAAKVSTRGGVSGREVEAYTRPKSALFNIFEPGAGSHMIAPKKKGVLQGPAGSASWTQKGRKRPGAFLSFRPVRHPGLAPRELLEPAFNAKVDEAVDVIVRTLFDVALFD